MASQAQILANQANSLLSTGPVTDEGKKKASLNAWRHGLTGQTVVMAAEDLKAYLAFRKDLFTQLQPANALESQLVGRIVDTQWRLNRCFSIECAVYAIGHAEKPGDVKCCDSQIHAVMTAVRVQRTQSQTIQSLSMHEQRLTRMYERAKAELERLQAARKAERRQELTNAACIRNYKERINQPWEPAENGFVFSMEHLDRFMSREQTLRDAANSFPKWRQSEHSLA